MGKHAFKKPRASNKALVALTIFSLTGIAGLGVTAAAFTDSATTTVSVNSGTISLTANGFASTTIDTGVAKWYPGAVSPVKTIILENTGDLPILVTMNTTGGAASGLATKLTTTMTNKSGGAAIGTANQVAKNYAFSNLRINGGASITINVQSKWTSVSNADDNTWAGKTDNLTYNFNAVSTV